MKADFWNFLKMRKCGNIKPTISHGKNWLELGRDYMSK